MSSSGHDAVRRHLNNHGQGSGCPESGEAAGQKGRRRSGFGVDQCTEHFVGSLQEAHASVGLMLTHFHLNQLLGQLDRVGHCLRGFSSRQRAISHDSAGLVNPLLAGLVRSKAGR